MARLLCEGTRTYSVLQAAAAKNSEWLHRMLRAPATIDVGLVLNSIPGLISSVPGCTPRHDDAAIVLATVKDKLAVA